MYKNFGMRFRKGDEFINTYSDKILEGDILVKLAHQQEITSEQWDSILLRRLVGEGVADALSHFKEERPSEITKGVLEYAIGHIIEVHANNRTYEEYLESIGTFGFRLGTDFKTNRPIMVNAREYSEYIKWVTISKYVYKRRKNAA